MPLLITVKRTTLSLEQGGMRIEWRLADPEKTLQRAVNLLRDREGFSESSKLVVI